MASPGRFFFVGACIIGVAYLISEQGHSNLSSLTTPTAPITDPASRVTPSQQASTITLRDILDGPRTAPPPTLPTMESGNYAAHCENEWTKRGVLDRSQYDYCIRMEHDGYNNLVSLSAKFSGLPWLQALIDGTIQAWSKRGSRDDSEIAYIVDQQTDSFLTLQYDFHQPGFNTDTATSCLEQWTKNGDPDWSETLYCYKQATGD